MLHQHMLQIFSPQLITNEVNVYPRCILNQLWFKPEFYPRSSMRISIKCFGGFFPHRNCLQLFTLQPLQGQVLSLGFPLSLPRSFLPRALQNNFFRLMFLVYFTSETGTLVDVKWAKSQSIFQSPNWLSLTYTISPPPQKPGMILQTGSLHLN